MLSLAAFAVIGVDSHQFKSCQVPQFEWAAYGNKVTGRMYGMAAAVNDNHIFAAGYLKSTLDPEAAGFVDITNDYAITGPYTKADYNGSRAATVNVDLKSYPTPGGAAENAGGSWRAYEAAVVKIDKTTGVPVRPPGAIMSWHHSPPTAHRPPPTVDVPGERVRVLRRGHGRDHRAGGAWRRAPHPHPHSPSR